MSGPFNMKWVFLHGWNSFNESIDYIKSSYNALKTISTEHERIHAGKMFHHSDVSTIAAGATEYTLFSINSSTECHLRHFEYDINVGPCEMYLYKDPFVDVASLGVGFRANNLNDTFPYTGAASYYHGPYINVSSIGVLLDAAGIVQATGGPVKTIEGGAASAVTEWVLAPGHSYVVSFANKNGATGLYSKAFTLYEPN